MVLLNSKTAIKVMGIILENPLQEFKEIELIRKAGTGKGSASELINSLAKEGLLAERRAGKTKLVSLNLVHPQSFLLKNLFDQEKLSKLSRSKLSSIILFRKETEKYTSLLVVFGSCAAGTATEKSDIDLLAVSDCLDEVGKIRKKVEESMGERLNLYFYTKEEILKKIKTDRFILNAFLKGVIISGYDLGRELFVNLKREEGLDERLLYFQERIKSALRNYLNKDYNSAKEILDRLLEQVVFYLLAEEGISYTSKKDAYAAAVKNLLEGKFIQKINRVRLEQKISLMEKLILEILEDKLLEGEGCQLKKSKKI